jgi:hypothetical protein
VLWPVFLLASCAPPPVRYFEPPPAAHEVFTTFTDTVLIRQQAPGDSVSADGVAFALDLLDYAAAARRTEAAAAVRGVIATVPDSARRRGEKPGVHDAEVYARVQHQSKARQFELMRADVLLVHTVRADTVEVTIGEGEEATVERWLALVLGGEAAADPTAGIR